ncbi:hypothetical protein CAAN3_01S00166 [[Candida] anglica]
MAPTQHIVKLHSGSREFSTLSNYSQEDIFVNENKKWTRIVFLIHGFPDINSSFDASWDTILNILPGTLLLAPTLRGYEPSSQGNLKDYKLSQLADDVRSWILEVSPAGTIPVHLVGHDWGAGVSFKTAHTYPDLLASISTLAFPYLTNIKPWEMLWYCPLQMYYSSYIFTMQFAFLYKKKLTDKSKNSYINKLWKFWSPTWKFSEDDIEEVKETFQKPGVPDSATAYYRCMDLKELAWPVDFDKVPTLILGGDSDGCMTKSVYELEARKLKNVPNVKVQLLSKLGHFLHRQDPVKVAEIFSDWILKHDV